MKAFWAPRSKIIDKLNYKKYTNLVLKIIKKYRAEIVDFTHKFKIFLKTNNLHSFENIEFPIFKNRKKCWTSNEY